MQDIQDTQESQVQYLISNHNENQINNDINTTINTTVCTNFEDIKKCKQRIDKMGNVIKKYSKNHKLTINDDIHIVEVVEIESYKEYNKDDSFSSIIFEAVSDLSLTCRSCIIM